MSDACVRLTLREIIVSILYAGQKECNDRGTKILPIHGRILLTKEIFLFVEEILKKHPSVQIEDPEFVPYRHGPFSFKVMREVEIMRWEGIIAIEGRRNSRTESFSLTERGLEWAKKIWETKISDTIKEKIKHYRVVWDEWGTEGILNYVYSKYPHMKASGQVSEKYRMEGGPKYG